MRIRRKDFKVFLLVALLTAAALGELIVSAASYTYDHDTYILSQK